MKDLVEAKGVRPRVGALEGVDAGADAVEQRAEPEQDDRRGRQTLEDARQRGDRHTPDGEIARCDQHSRRRDPGDANDDRVARADPQEISPGQAAVRGQEFHCAQEQSREQIGMGDDAAGAGGDGEPGQQAGNDGCPP